METIADVRRRFPRFGPKKMRARLALDRPDIAWPAPSTIGDILKRERLIETRPRRRRPLAQGEIVAGSDVPNGEWGIDFKGWFRTRDGHALRSADGVRHGDALSRGGPHHAADA